MISEREYLEMELERIKREISYLLRCESSEQNERKLQGLSAMKSIIMNKLKGRKR